MSTGFRLLALVSILVIAGCASVRNPGQVPPPSAPEPTPKTVNPARVVHVIVALCDNENQGIVPVPAHLGNGEDPSRNLYWGAAYGIRTYFGKSKKWSHVATIPTPQANVLERVVYRHRATGAYLVADAYRGVRIREAIADFFAAVSGERDADAGLAQPRLAILAGANLVAYVGHNGLMDFDLPDEVRDADGKRRDAVVLACASRSYFTGPLKKTAARPLLWTTNLMAPEAYVLHDALEGWTSGEEPGKIRERAAAAYARYQRIGISAARGLLVTGW